MIIGDMLSRSVAFLVWALVAATAVYWGSRFMARPSGVSAPVVALDVSAAAGADLSRLLGAALAPAPVVAAAPATSSRFRLTGVAAPQHAGESGLALISVDGGPPRVYRVGAAIEGAWLLREVGLRSATLVPAGNSNDAAAAFMLELPPLAAAAGAPVAAQPGAAPGTTPFIPPPPPVRDPNNSPEPPAP